MESTMNGVSKGQFVKVDPAKLQSVLKSRLPHSAGIYNASRFHEKWTNNSTWYTLDGDISESSWIVLVINRIDFCQDISVSRSPETAVTPYVKESFASCNCIDWSSTYIFSAIDVQVSAMVADIGTRIYGNCTICHPCYLFYMDIQDGLLLNDNYNLDEGVQVKDLNDELGNKFILSTWKYATKGSDQFIKMCLARNESSGVIVNGTPVAGVVFAPHGLISMLYTLSEYRAKGYGKMVMHSIMKDLSKKEYVPSCTVEIRNERSKAFQIKVGFKVASIVDYIVYEKAEY